MLLQNPIIDVKPFRLGRTIERHEVLAQVGRAVARGMVGGEVTLPAFHIMHHPLP